MQVAITAIGVANPPYKQQQKVAAEMVIQMLQLKPANARLLKSIYRSTGIEYRYSVMNDFCKMPGEYEFFPNDHTLPFPSTALRMQLYKEHAFTLAFSAVKACLASLPHFDVKEISHLITVSCTGMYAPGIDIELVQALQLHPHTKRSCINFMGCYGAFNAIKMADAICKAEPAAKVLVVSVELCTIHFQKSDASDSIFSNAIFADGAGAVLIEANPRQAKYLTLDAFHCDLLLSHSKDMTWHIADSGFDIALSSYVPAAIESGIAIFTERLLHQQQMELQDLDLFAIHPGGYKILKACEKALNIHAEQNKYAYEVLRQYGNMSSATILFVLKAIWDDLHQGLDNKKIFSCAFGPGLTLEAMLLRTNCR